MNLPIEISARHVHLTAEHWAALFGAEQPSVGRTLSQPGQFVTTQRLTIANDETSIERVGIILPFRSATQVELAMTDARRLGLDVPVAISGQLQNSAMITLTGPVGSISVPAAIIPQRHLHLNPADGAVLNIVDGQDISVVINGPRGGRLDHVRVRMSPDFQTALHLDTDEGNALGITPGMTANPLLS
jgi:propanediol utilization protein